MKIKNNSHFKNQHDDFLYLENWIKRLEQSNQRTYERIQINTTLGKTHVWGINTEENNTETLVIFP